jgi:hypothetical protein
VGLQDSVEEGVIEGGWGGGFGGSWRRLHLGGASLLASEEERGK